MILHTHTYFNITINIYIYIHIHLCLFLLFFFFWLHPIHSKHTKSSPLRPEFFSVSPFLRRTRRPCAVWPNWPWRSARGLGPWSRFWRRRGTQKDALQCRFCWPDFFLPVLCCFFFFLPPLFVCEMSLWQPEEKDTNCVLKSF